MDLRQLWRNRSRAGRNVAVVLAIDVLLLAAALLGVPGLVVAWSVLTEYVPNVYEPVFLQFIALVRDMSPGSLVAGGVFVTYSTLFLTLATVHGVAAYGVGFLLQKAGDSWVWSVVNYAVLLMVLVVFHVFLTFRNYFLLL